ncbi:ABC transporter permease [Pelagibacterium limicola]|uniref:ABC transporter permease n=1 Tax=Pelagibacterium limicola TaxID=2791022 RepID=UPI0018AFB732|nr:ABC transporter permease [Pelagibacterium limicola]
MAFVLRRLGFYIAAFFIAATINFILPRLMPGNPIDIMFAQATTTIPPEARAALIETFGFATGPLHEQYFAYLKSVFTGDLGYSIRYYPQTVNERLGWALPWTLLLAGTATVLAFALGSLIGVFAAWKRGGGFDALVTPASLALQAIPPLVIAILALFTFGLVLRWLPTGYAYNPSLDPGFNLTFIGSVFFHALMPVFSLMIVFIGGYLVTMRNNMIGQLGEDHVIMGLAKGLSERRVKFNYAARNALLPSVTSLGLTLGAILGGSLVTEVVFNYPGLGQMLYIGIVTRDYPLIQGQLLIMTLAILTANLIVDLAYVLLDPRLRRA